MDKFLIVGLGNPGADYHLTRHNIGWMVLDKFAEQENLQWEDKRYGFITQTSVKGRKLILLKPTTYMNLSGNAVRYWLEKEHIDESRLLVLVDDLVLPLAKTRLRGSGSNGGHNGLGHINQLIGEGYARIRIGIGNDYAKGQQIDFVLGKFTENELALMSVTIENVIEEIKSFALQGLERTMNQFNKK